MPSKREVQGILSGMEGASVSVIFWVMSFAAALVSAMLGAILAYHWFSFGSSKADSVTALALYTTGCSICVVILIALAAAI